MTTRCMVFPPQLRHFSAICDFRNFFFLVNILRLLRKIINGAPWSTLLPSDSRVIQRSIEPISFHTFTAAKGAVQEYPASFFVIVRVVLLFYCCSDFSFCFPGKSVCGGRCVSCCNIPYSLEYMPPLNIRHSCHFLSFLEK